MIVLFEYFSVFFLICWEVKQSSHQCWAEISAHVLDVHFWCKVPHRNQTWLWVDEGTLSLLSSLHIADEEAVLMSTIKGNTCHNHLTSVIYCNHQCLLLAPKLRINPPEYSLMSAQLPFWGRKVSDLFPVLIMQRYWFGQVKWSYSARRTALFSHMTLYTSLKMRFQNKANVNRGSALLRGSHFNLIHTLLSSQTKHAARDRKSENTTKNFFPLFFGQKNPKFFWSLLFKCSI